jgi:hypothetical protein
VSARAPVSAPPAHPPSTGPAVDLGLRDARICPAWSPFHPCTTHSHISMHVSEAKASGCTGSGPVSAAAAIPDLCPALPDPLSTPVHIIPSFTKGIIQINHFFWQAAAKHSLPGPALQPTIERTQFRLAAFLPFADMSGGKGRPRWGWEEQG